MSNVLHKSLCVTFLAATLGLRASAEPPIVTQVKTPSAVRVERTPVQGGGELFTFLKTVPDPRGTSLTAEVPFVSVLRDTMGDQDPENDVFRDVWALTQKRPSVFRRGIAMIPFLYHRAGSASPVEELPPALLDLSAASKGTVPRVLGNLAQSTVLDAQGLPFRATTRAYRARAGEYRNMHLWRTLELLNSEHAGAAALSREQLNFLRGRILLARNLFGGFVDDQYVVPAWKKFERSTAETRGRNWELLRQRAEENGLYFQPLELARNTPSFALLWIKQSDALDQNRKFDSKFLGISNPFGDPRLGRWKDYSEFWRFDEFGSRVPDGAPASSEARMIPLALYSLEHPRVPLVIVDFRDAGKPRRREMVRRATDDVATGVLGLTGFGNWTWFAVRTAATFVHGRRVAPLDRSARVRAYIQVRQALSTDTRLAPELREVLVRRLDKLGLNPFDNASRAELEIATSHYHALLDSARNGGLRKHLDKQRIREAEHILHSRKSRTLRRVASIATLGIYRHRETESPTLLHLVDRQRRIDFHRRNLEHALAAGPRPEVTMNMDTVRRSVEQLTALTFRPGSGAEDVQSLLNSLLERTSDEETRMACRAALGLFENGGQATAAASSEPAAPNKAPGDGGQ